MEPVEASWDITPDGASKAQRHALYRLGYARSLVRKLSREGADKLIKSGIAVRSELADDKEFSFVGEDYRKNLPKGK